MSPSELIGYADRISAAPGGTVGFKVSTDLARFDAAIVRLIHGDANGPGFKEELVAELGPRHGRKQHAVAGSYGRIAHSAALEPAHGFSLAAWAFPTMPAGGVQAIAAKWSRGSGYALVIGSDGAGRAVARRWRTHSPDRQRRGAARAPLALPLGQL